MARGIGRSANDDLGVEDLARTRRSLDADPDLEPSLLARRERAERERLRRLQTRPLDAHASLFAGLGRGFPQHEADDLARRLLRADEQVGRFGGDDLHQLASCPAPCPAPTGVERASRHEYAGA